jgi:hypothetical protein
MDWMKENDYNSSPDLTAIDGLVESTGMKPSQIVAWIAELGASVVKLRSGGVAVEDPVVFGVEVATEKQPEIITIEDDDDDEAVSVPELAEESDKDDNCDKDDDISSLLGLAADEMIDDFYAKYAGVSLSDATKDVDVASDVDDEATWHSLIAEVFDVMDADEFNVVAHEESETSVAMPCKVLQDASDVHDKAEGEAALESSCLESSEVLVLERGFKFDDDCECGPSMSSKCVQERMNISCIDGISSNSLLVSLTIDDDVSINELDLSLSGLDEDLYSPSTCIRSDSTDSLFG